MRLSDLGAKGANGLGGGGHRQWGPVCCLSEMAQWRERESLNGIKEHRYWLQANPTWSENPHLRSRERERHAWFAQAAPAQSSCVRLNVDPFMRTSKFYIIKGMKREREKREGKGEEGGGKGERRGVMSVPPQVHVQ